MILEYYRPESVDDALKLLSQTSPRTVPLGGGTVLNALSKEKVAVVDLQRLGWDQIEPRGRDLHIGATATLQDLMVVDSLQYALKSAIRLQAAFNLRQTGTVAGGLVSGDGRSPFLAAMLALDAGLLWQPGNKSITLGEFLPLRGGEWPGKVISEVVISTQAVIALEYVARSPADKPVVCAAAARWPSGRTRIVLGGYGKAPQTIMDGEANDGVLDAARAAYLTAGDQWASAKYRSTMAGILAKRCLEQVNGA